MYDEIVCYDNLMFDQEPDLSSSICRQTSSMINLDDYDMWIRACEERAVLLKRIMPMAFENLTIAQHRDRLRYATIRGGGYCPRVQRYNLRVYVYLQQTSPTILDVTARRII